MTTNQTTANSKAVVELLNIVDNLEELRKKEHTRIYFVQKGRVPKYESDRLWELHQLQEEVKKVIEKYQSK